MKFLCRVCRPVMFGHPNEQDIRQRGSVLMPFLIGIGVLGIMAAMWSQRLKNLDAAVRLSGEDYSETALFEDYVTYKTDCVESLAALIWRGDGPGSPGQLHVKVPYANYSSSVQTPGGGVGYINYDLTGTDVTVNGTTRKLRSIYQGSILGADTIRRYQYDIEIKKGAVWKKIMRMQCPRVCTNNTGSLRCVTP